MFSFLVFISLFLYLHNLTSNLSNLFNFCSLWRNYFFCIVYPWVWRCRPPPRPPPCRPMSSSSTVYPHSARTQRGVKIRHQEYPPRKSSENPPKCTKTPQEVSAAPPGLLYSAAGTTLLRRRAFLTPPLGSPLLHRTNVGLVWNNNILITLERGSARIENIRLH